MTFMMSKQVFLQEVPAGLRTRKFLVLLENNFFVRVCSGSGVRLIPFTETPNLLSFRRQAVSWGDAKQGLSSGVCRRRRFMSINTLSSAPQHEALLCISEHKLTAYHTECRILAPFVYLFADAASSTAPRHQGSGQAHCSRERKKPKLELKLRNNE